MTQILATVGPRSLNREIIKQCTDLGVNLFRINLSHTSLDDVTNCIEKIQNWTHVPICLDSEGAQIRNQNMKGKITKFIRGELVKIHFSTIIGDSANISFTPVGVAKKFEINDIISIDFDGAKIRVIELHTLFCMAEVIHEGDVGNNKAADIDKEVELSAITEKDEMAIAIARRLGIKHFALSFANSAKDISRMREICGHDCTIISKIESVKALLNLSEILNETDEILIDRGDLSRQIPLEKIPFLQRRIISNAKANGCPVHVATNLLESMVVSVSPTRAELNDVVSTLLMGADGLVLAAETAIGKFPVEAVKMIRSLADTTEKWTPETSINEVLMF